MKINKTRSKKILYIPAVAVLVLIFSYAALARNQGMWPFANNTESSETKHNGPTDEDKEVVERNNAQNKQDFLDKENVAEKETTNTETKKNTPINDSRIDMVATSENQSVVVRVKLKNVSSGNCNLTLTKGSTAVSESAEVVYAPEYSTCTGFTIDKNRLSDGLWNIKLSIKSPSGTFEKTITHRV